MKVLIVALIVFVGCACASNKRSKTPTPCGPKGDVDIDCVRTWLSDRSSCKPISNGDNLDPYSINQVYCFLPSFNLTAVKAPNQQVYGLSKSTLQQFTVDYDNNVTIIVLYHPLLLHPGNDLRLFFHRVGKASIKVKTGFADHYDELITTTFIPGTDCLDLDNRQTKYYMAAKTSYDAFGSIELTVAIAKYEIVAKVVKYALLNMYTLLSEILNTLSKEFSYGFIGQNICTLDNPEKVVAVEPVIY